MKITFNKFFPAILFFTFAIASLHAQTNSEDETSNIIAASGSPTDNAPPSVGIDSSGMHVGGPNPVNVDFFPLQKLALLIPLVAIIMGCSIPIIIIGLQIYFRHRKNKMLHETIRLMVEKGAPIPPELFAKTGNEFMEHDKPKRPRNDLRIGVIFIGIGIGIVMITGKPGYIILFMGVAFVVASLFERKDKNDVQPPKQ